MLGGETAYHSAFGRVSNTLATCHSCRNPFSSSPSAAIPDIHLSILVVENFIALFINTLAIATLLWAYTVSSWGLHRLGESQIKLKFFLEDRMMGAKPIGNCCAIIDRRISWRSTARLLALSIVLPHQPFLPRPDGFLPGYRDYHVLPSTEQLTQEDAGRKIRQSKSTWPPILKDETGEPSSFR